ncbi:hypothetical protein C1645_409380 [Glomus cerebriforme]|uniref:Uncharacterized protein n=1 Tax=Glomus cerebriforme TaxID=658196 RepID=A0A397TMG7_9GLOM|nr:hypothetical protein C1645_409380 [Glomus cerebriforme]
MFTDILANELLIITFKELLKETSFKYMNSIYTVCKKWKKLIELVLIEEIEFRLKNKLLIEYGFNNCSTQNISYDFLNSTFNIFINGNHFKLYFSNILETESIKKKKMCTRKMYINFKYENSKEYLVEFNLGTLLFYRKKNLYEKYEIKTNIKWNYEDYMCISTREYSKYNYFCILITAEKLILSLKKMCIILDLLDEKLNTKDSHKNHYKYITKKTIPLLELDAFLDFDFNGK